MRRVGAARGLIGDLYSDGFGPIGLLGPLSAIAIIGMKLFSLPLIEGISGLWALAPLTLWLFVAYIRRRKMVRLSETALRHDLSLKQLLANRTGAGERELVGALLEELRGKALRDEISVWGRFAMIGDPSSPRPISRINSIHWCDYEICVDRYFTDASGRTDNRTRTAESWYQDLWFNKSQIEREFPTERNG